MPYGSRRFAHVRIAYVDARLAYRDYLVYLIRHVLHAVCAQRVLRAHLPAGACHVRRGVPVVGRVEDYRPLGLAGIGHLEQRLLERGEVLHRDLSVIAALLLNGGGVVLDGDIFIVQQAAAAQQTHCQQQRRQRAKALHHFHFTSDMLSKPLPNTFFASVTTTKACSSMPFTRRLSSDICGRFMTHMITSCLSPE